MSDYLNVRLYSQGLLYNLGGFLHWMLIPSSLKQKLVEHIQQAAMCSQTPSLLRCFSYGFLDRLTTLEWKRN